MLASVSLTRINSALRVRTAPASFAEVAYVLAKGIFAPTHRLFADLAQLLAEIEGGSTPQKRRPEKTAAPFQLA
jgi:hypothetical protein